jgi:hypothetical protein
MMLSSKILILGWVFGIVGSLQQKIRDGLMSDVPIMRVFGTKAEDNTHWSIEGGLIPAADL